jgi:GNAT superfamily N-acetyltransferase/uncharacterized glyoxalase superfamily protein PhnB
MIPILPVADIVESLNFYREVLGVTNSWTHGNPPSHAGCRLGMADLQFTLNPDLCVRTSGLSLFIFVDCIEELYTNHISKGAEILEPLEVKPWNFKEYSVKDCNNVRLRFAQSGFLEPRKEKLLDVQVVRRKLTTTELRMLMTAVHWSFDDDESQLEKSVNEPLCTAVAEFEGRCIGTGAILGHQTGNYLISNVIVHPDFQSRGVGKQIMGEPDRWLAQHGIPNAMVKLFTGPDRQAFYSQFGYRGPEHGLVGMIKVLPPK